MKQLQNFINEERFGYTYENAFICAIKSIDDKDKAKAIIKKWFNDEDSSRGLRSFLFRLGYEPKSKSADDIYDAIMSINMDNNYNLK